MSLVHSVELRVELGRKLAQARRGVHERLVMGAGAPMAALIGSASVMAANFFLLFFPSSTAASRAVAQPFVKTCAFLSQPW